MNRLVHIILFLGLALGTAAASLPVNAQSFGEAFAGIGDNDEPVNIKADRLEIIDKQKTAILTGKVSVTQGTSVVLGKEIWVFYQRNDAKTQTRSGIERIEITGRVTIRSEDNRAEADKVVINLIENDATLTGNVQLSQGENSASACSMWVDLETRHTKLNHSCKERIKIIARPQESEEE